MFCMKSDEKYQVIPPPHPSRTAARSHQGLREFWHFWNTIVATRKCGDTQVCFHKRWIEGNPLFPKGLSRIQLQDESEDEQMPDVHPTQLRREQMGKKAEERSIPHVHHKWGGGPL
ncbi:hypothetical protein E3N88_00086 [Mikania micrantha]|uniref:Uncharacterized protein n=1 Tax=Mikania micrantha TaxID=192012 RepID=A0A5N6PZU8_9ASTR|nr:hypothetical protein E3N88_00086 [Mikania micrantha]